MKRFSVNIFMLLMFCMGYSYAQNNKTTKENVFVLSCLKNLFANVDINDASAAMKVWAQQIENKIGYGVKIEVKIFGDIQELLNYSGRDDLGIIMSNSIDYLRIRPQMQVYPVFIPSLYDDYLILVKNEQYKKIDDLKGKSLGLLQIDSNPIPAMWLNLLLYKSKFYNKIKFFGSTEEFNSESKLILAVFFDRKDACVVSRKSFETMTELNPQVGKILKAVAVSPVYLAGLTCFSRNSIKYSYKEKFKEIVINLDSYPEGRQFMSLMRAEKMKFFKPENIESVERLFNEFETMPQKNKFKF